MGQNTRVQSSGIWISQTAVSKQLQNTFTKQKSDLSPVSLFNSLFIVTNKPSEVKMRCVKFLLEALPFKSRRIANEHGSMGFISEFFCSSEK